MYWSLDGLYSVLPAARVLQLVDDEGAGVISADPPNAAYNRVVRAGTKAETLIDSYLRGHYTVPLTPVPTLITSIACVLTATELYMLSDVDELPQKLRDERKQALAMLDQIRDDKLRLTEEESPAQDILVNKTAADRIFTDAVLNRY